MAVRHAAENYDTARLVAPRGDVGQRDGDSNTWHSNQLEAARQGASHGIARRAAMLLWHRMPTLRSRRPIPTAAARGRSAGHAVVAAALLWARARTAAAGDAAAPKAAAPSEPSLTTVTTIVAGIVGYSRWPAQMKSIRLCTVGLGHGVEELLAAADLGSTQLSVPVRAATATTWNECDAIYVGALTVNATRNLLQSMVGRPVLTIGEGQEFCADGGMFCLQTGGAAVRFAVNLDAVARSGVRVNPWVLRIARNATASGP
jgi:hypothetical protein